MQRISLSKLLLVVVLVPVTALMLFAGRLTYESWSRYQDLERASSLLRLAVAASRFAGIAMPAEGAASRAYLAGGDKAKLDAQRRITDEHYRAMREAAAANTVKHPRIEEHLRAIDERMRDIATMRGTIDAKTATPATLRSEEHTSELQSRGHLVCRLLLEKKKLRRVPHDPDTTNKADAIR